MSKSGRHIWVDTGRTFTNYLGIGPDSRWHRTKVLSSSWLRGTLVQVVSERELKIKSRLECLG